MLLPSDRRLERPGIPHRDYILTEYKPRADPTGRLHASSLFRFALRQAGWLDAVWPICETLQAALGPEQTVWGFKYGPQGFGVELYFYNFSQNGPDNDKSVEKLRAILAPHLRFDAGVDEAARYFMCSFELTHQGLAEGRGEPFRIYVRTGDQGRQEAGFSYRVEPGAMVMENHYWFYKAADKTELEDAVRRVAHSPRTGTKQAWGTLLPRYLREDCTTICYAVKPRSDSVYYSRIGTPALARFLERHLPGPVAQALRAHDDDFAHVGWDLGFDYCARPSDARVALPKIGIYSVL